MTPQGIEKISHNSLELALILRSTFKKDGIEFFTSDTYSQQLGYMNRPAGYVIPPHVHNAVVRKVEFTKEVLFIRSGRVRVDFYSEDQVYLESAVLEPGDVILLARGGHGFQMLEPTEIIEVKQGPYTGDQDKTRFTPNYAETLKFR
jgi:mannose-6-phosphate isomerase-like protein (cupin superfamily)